MAFIFFGWGERQKRWKIPDGRYLIVSWNYFELLWCPIAFKIRWHLIEDDKINFNGHPTKLTEEGKIATHIILEDRAIPFEKAKEFFSGRIHNLNIWERYGLVIIIAGVVINHIWF